MYDIYQFATIFVPAFSAILLLKCGYLCIRDGVKWRWSDLILPGSALAILAFLWQANLPLALVVAFCLDLLLLLRYLLWGSLTYILMNGECTVFANAAGNLAKFHFDARRGFLLQQVKAAKLMVQGDRNTANALLERLQPGLPVAEWYANELLMLAGARSASDDKEIISRVTKLVETSIDSRYKFTPLLVLSLAHMKRGEPEEAFAALAKIDCFVAPTYKKVFELGLRSALGCTESMEVMIRQNKVPEFAATYFRGLSSFARGDVDQAKSKWKQAIELIDANPRSKDLASWREVCEKRLRGANSEGACVYTAEREKRLDDLLRAISTPRRRGLYGLALPPTVHKFQSDNVIPIETHQCAGFFRRFFATSFDCAIVFLASVFVMFVFPVMVNLNWGVPTQHSSLTSTQETVMIVLTICGALLVVACSLLYGPLFESSRLQATPGKYLLNLNVVRIDGNRMQFNEALHKQGLQHILAAVLGICFPVYAVSYVFLTGKHKQTIYDKVGNRVVLVKGPPRTRMIVSIVAALLIMAGLSVVGVLNMYRDLSPECHDIKSAREWLSTSRHSGILMTGPADRRINVWWLQHI
jgi:uncharacterized RDD family membrane protein YckC